MDGFLASSQRMTFAKDHGYERLEHLPAARERPPAFGSYHVSERRLQNPYDEPAHKSSSQGPYNIRPQRIHLPFLGLCLTTSLSIVLLIADIREWALSDLYGWVNDHRATIQTVVQIIAAILGGLQIAAVGTLFNYAKRTRMREPFKLGSLSLWTSLSFAHFRWNLPFPQQLVLSIFLVLCASIPALWAGAISPVSTVLTVPTFMNTARYTDISNIREWPAQVTHTGPTRRTAKGLFTFYPAMLSAGDLTETLTTASTPDGSVRQHTKIDNTKYTYYGRSYGIGAAVGLTDNFAALNYTFQETGYNAQTTCVFNSSTQFILLPGGGGSMIYGAQGYLPDSTSEEFSTYFGYDDSAIVAIGIAAHQHKGLQYLGIAAGSSYAFLNATQCQTTYTPARFQVNVDVISKNITVQPIDAPTVLDIDPSGNLSHNVHRSFSSYSADLTNLYQSEIGNAINQSISDYRTFANNSQSEGRVVLSGLENSVTAFIDDILGLYAAAQVMVINDTTIIPVEARINAFRFGQSEYVIAISLVNLFVLVMVIWEAIRTRNWKGLSSYDFCEPGSLVVATSKGRARIENDDVMVHLETSSQGYAIVASRGSMRSTESANHIAL